MPYRLLGAHINWTVTGLPETIKRWKPPLVVLLDHSDVWHEVKQVSPDTILVGRLMLPQSDEPNFNDPGVDPIRAARDHCEKVLPLAQRMGQTYSYWQGVNEPTIASAEAMQRCADFDAERARIMDKNGFRVVVGSFSVGNPELLYWAQFLPALEAARQYGGALALHEYAWPTLEHEWPWYLLRHRKVYDGEPDHEWAGLPSHLKSLPLLITECGLDGLIEQEHKPRGWRVLYGQEPDEYLRQLAWYDAELLKDPYVVGAAIYCLATPDPVWKSYDIWPDLAPKLAAAALPLYRLADQQPSLPSPSPEPLEPTVSPTAGWRIEVAYRPGSRIIAGSLPEAGIELTIADPWGNVSRVVSGSKPEHGVGGFEVLTPHVATYSLAFSGQSFEVKTGDRTTFVTFDEVEPPPVPPAEPVEEPVEEPIEEPMEEPPAEPPEQPIEEPLEPPSEEPAEAPVEEPVEEPLAEPPEQPIEEPLEPPFEEPPVEPLEQPVEEPVELPSEEPAEEPVEEPVEEPPVEPLEQPIEEPVEPPFDEPAEAPVEEPVEEPPVEPLEPPIEEPVERPSEGPVEAPDEDALLEEAMQRVEQLVDKVWLHLAAGQDDSTVRSEDMDLPKIYDQQGQERDWDWLVANFGAVRLERAEVSEGVEQVYRLVALQDAVGPAVSVINVVDRQGNPLEGVRVVRYWPDAPTLPAWPTPTSRWRQRGVFGETNDRGDIGFGMGHGDYYFAPKAGASAVWIAKKNGPSDLIDGLGMLGGTEHRHLNVFYQLQDAGGESPPPPPPPPPPPTPAPPPPPTGDNWEALFARLDRIIYMLEQRLGEP